MLQRHTLLLQHRPHLRRGDRDVNVGDAEMRECVHHRVRNRTHRTCNRFRPGRAIAPAIVTDARGVAALWKPLYSDGRYHCVERANGLRYPRVGGRGFCLGAEKT